MASSSPSSAAMAMQTTFQVVKDNEAATEDAGTRDNSDAGAPQQSSRLSSYMSANYSHDSLATDDMHLMNSFTEETFLEMLDFGSGEPLPAALTLEAVHAAVASERYHVLGAPSTKVSAIDRDGCRNRSRTLRREPQVPLSSRGCAPSTLIVCFI